jgi:predicted aminopeptidase
MNTGHLQNLTLPLIACVICFLSLLTGCASPKYYTQAAFGQWELWKQSRPIQEVIDDKKTSELEKKKLNVALNILQFADKRLLLPSQGSYQDYVKLDRKHVAWNVFASPKDSLKPTISCFIIAGCIPYRGYFSKIDADNYAEKLKIKGYDTFVSGVSAYSTLGWLNDPMLSTLIKRQDTELAKLLFHELAHQKIYLKNNTTFNESFATAIANQGVILWASSRSTSLISPKENMEPELIRLVVDTQQKLQSLYSSDQTLDSKLIRKKEYFKNLETQYELLKKNWGGSQIYDAWMTKEWNNAKILTIGTYYDYVPYFNAVINSCGRDFEKVYKAITELSLLNKSLREDVFKAFEAKKIKSISCH